MKKIFILVFVSMFFTASAFAASITIDDANAYEIGALSFNVSNNVVIKYDSNTNFYTAESYHTSGSRVFLTDSVESKIYWKDPAVLGATYQLDDVTAAAVTASPGTHGTPDPTSGTDWTAL